jgi:hypothetical protein
MSAVKAVIINYVTPTAPTLTVKKTANYGSVTGGGLTCGNALATCGPAIESLNGSYTLTATPATGHALASSIDCTQNFTVTAGGGTLTCTAYNKATFTMNTSKTVQINYNH